MTPRDVFLNRRHRVGLIVGTAVASAFFAVAVGITTAGLMQWPDRPMRWVSLGSYCVLFAYCLFVLVKRVRWLDSAVPEPVPPRPDRDQRSNDR